MLWQIYQLIVRMFFAFLYSQKPFRVGSL